MFTHHYLQDRLNSMILTPEEAETFKTQRAQYAKTNRTHIAQEKLEAAREASVSLLKSLFTEEKELIMPIDVRVLADHFGIEPARRSSFGTKR